MRQHFPPGAIQVRVAPDVRWQLGVAPPATHSWAAFILPFNCTNDNEIYSFHAGGAQAVFADGSVRFMSQEIELRVLARWLTREAGDQGA